VAGLALLIGDDYSDWLRTLGADAVFALGL
jgi:hypothetical protein